MRTKLAGALAHIAMVFTLLWVDLIRGMVRGDVVETFDQALQCVRNRDGLYVPTNANAVLITVS